MGSHSLFFSLPIAVLSISVAIVWLNAASIYKKMHPNEDFSLFADQLFMFRQVDWKHPLASKFHKRRIAVIVIIALSMVHGNVFNLLNV